MTTAAAQDHRQARTQTKGSRPVLVLTREEALKRCVELIASVPKWPVTRVLAEFLKGGTL